MPTSEPSSDEPAAKVTVIIPTFNAVDETLDALGSVQNQTLQSWKAIVVDDGSTLANQKKLKAALNAWGDPRTSYFALKKNLGVAAARSFGLSQVTTRYVAFLDADDLWHPKKLKKHLKYMRKKEAAFSFTSYVNFNERKNVRHERRPPKRVTYDGLLARNVIGNSTVIIDLEKLTPPKIPDLRRRQDYAFWLAILRSGEVGYGYRKPLTIRRIMGRSLSSNKLIAAKDTWKMYRKLPDQSLWNSSRLFGNYLRGSLSTLRKERLALRSKKRRKLDT